MNGLSSSACFSKLTGTCYNGATFNLSCFDGILNTTINIPGYPSMNYRSQTNLYKPCSIVSAYGNYSQCLADIYGGMCDCCATISVKSNFPYSKGGVGQCVPENSPLAALNSVLSGRHLVAAISAVFFIWVLIL